MKRWSVGLSVVCLSLFGACGGDDGGGNAKTNASSQEKAGSGATKDNEGVPCGKSMCTAPTGSTSQACCIDQFSGTCGVVGGGTCRAAPKTDDRCPVPDLKLMLPSNGSISQPVGCCTSDNECGVDFGVGCQSRTVLCMGIGLDQLDKLKAETCDGKELPLPAGCGTMMVTLPGVAGQGGGM
jgi:hypothetical protein